MLELQEVAKPTPSDNEILVRTRATTVNRTDCGFRAAKPFIVRFFLGIVRPKRPILGGEFAGDVEAVGKDVTTFAVGDRVFGLSGGAGGHAEYIRLREHGAVTTMPVNMSYEEAASICDGATLALDSLRRADVRAGQRILIYGASGSVGTAAVQLARQLRAEVTAVCGTRNLELVRSLGADEVIDYTQGDFTKHGQTYDVVFDAAGKTSFFRCRGLLERGGVYIATDLGFLAQNPLLVLWTAKIGSKRVVLTVPKQRKQDVVLFRDLIEAGKLRAVIDRRYSLEQIAEAHRYVDTGRKTGSVVVTVNDGA